MLQGFSSSQPAPRECWLHALPGSFGVPLPGRQGSGVPLGKSRAGSRGRWKWAACDPLGGKRGYSKQPLPAKGGNNYKIQVNGLRYCPPGCVTSPDSRMSAHLQLNQTSFSCATQPLCSHVSLLCWGGTSLVRLSPSR